jgi:hypothetical protein
MVLPQPGSSRDAVDCRPADTGPDSQDNALVDVGAARGGACARIQITTGRVCALPAGHQGECRFAEQQPEEPEPQGGPEAAPVAQAWTEGDVDSAGRPW